MHLVEREAEAVKELFRRYSSGATTLSRLAGWMNAQGFNTRNMHRLRDIDDGLAGGPSMFTTASVRGILHNPFYAGKIKHLDQLLPGNHDALVSQELFDLVQSTMKRNSSRSETLQPRPEREYLLKGLIKCAHCGMSLWAQTLTSGSRLYREQARSRSHIECPGDSKSIRCETPDDQMGRLVGAIVLPEAWMDRVLARIHLADEVEMAKEERIKTEHRLKRLGDVYLDGLKTREDYLKEKNALEERLGGIVVPGVDAAKEAGKLPEDLPQLWVQANLTERRKLLTSMLDAVYVDTVEEKSIVAIRPKPAFQPLFEIATTREGSDVILIKEPPQTDFEPKAAWRSGPLVPSQGMATERSCFWWRRGRVDLYLKHGLAVLVAATVPSPPFTAPSGTPTGSPSLER